MATDHGSSHLVERGSARRRLSSVVLAVVACAVALTPQLATRPLVAAAAAAPAPSPSTDPWSDPAYTPQKGVYQPYILAPASRTVPATAVVGAVANNGSVTNGGGAITGGATGATMTYGGTDTLHSPRITLDFGKEVGGNLVINVTGTSAPAPKVRAAFSESLLFMSLDGTNGNFGDYANSTSSALNGQPVNPYTQPYDYESHPLNVPIVPAIGQSVPVTDTNYRGGFRYVALFLESAGSVSINGVSMNFGQAPQQANLRDYKGWFLSNDNQLNKEWYSGAYTMQMDTEDPKQGKCVPPPPLTPDNDACPVGEGTTILVDGAKRDRLPWGFTNFEESVAYVSTQDYTSAYNNIRTRLDAQQPNGYIPSTYPGTPNSAAVELGAFLEIHLPTIRSIEDYVLYSGDTTFLQASFPKVQLAVQYGLGFIDNSGLVNDNSFGCVHNIGYAECAHTMTANALMYACLRSGAELADLAGQPAQATTWRATAAQLAGNVNAKLYDSARGAYLQSVEDPGVISQEGTSLAVYWGLAPTANAQRALAYLKDAHWNQYGSAIWDRPGGNMKSGADATIPWARYNDPYPTYYEVASRLAQHDDADAATLLHTYWGHMLDNDPRYPGSPPLTMWERETMAGLPTLFPNFPAPLVSQAHDWGAGPTAALTRQVLGVEPTGPGFSTFRVQPHPLDLHWIQGAVPTPAGPIQVSVDLGTATAGTFAMDVTVPAATSAEVSVPLLGSARSIAVDGVVTAPASSDGYYAVYRNVGAGVHHFTYANVPASQPVCPTGYQGTATWPTGTTASATSTAANRTKGPDDVQSFGAANAIDGNPGSSWEAGNASAATLTVTPGQATLLQGVRLWLGGEGPPSTITVTGTVNGVATQLGQVTGNHKSLVDVQFTPQQTVTALQVSLDGAAADAFGAQRVRLFEVEPLVGLQPLSLNTSLSFDCTSAGVSPALIAPPIVAKDTVPIFFHDANSDLQSSGTTEPMRVMDTTAPSATLPPFGQHFKSTGGPGSGETTHFQWATPTLTQVGLHNGIGLVGYAYHVFVLVSFPGAQPAGVANLNVNLDRIAPDGTRTHLGKGVTPIPQGTLNQELNVSGEVPVSATLAPGDRLVADVFVSGVEASSLYFSYDDSTYASGILLEPTPLAPPADVPESPWAPLVLLVAGPVVLAPIRRRRRGRGTPAQQQ